MMGATMRCGICNQYMPDRCTCATPGVAASLPAEQAAPELRTYVIMVRPGMVPVVKGPLPDKKWVEDMLRELYKLHADAQCMVIDLPVESWPQSGIEWIDMYGDKRRTPIRAALAARQAPTDPMCERKTDHIMQRDGYAKTGYVLKKEGQQICVSDCGAVAWFAPEQWQWLMHGRDHVEFEWPKPIGAARLPPQEPVGAPGEVAKAVQLPQLPFSNPPAAIRGNWMVSITTMQDYAREAVSLDRAGSRAPDSARDAERWRFVRRYPRMSAAMIKNLMVDDLPLDESVDALIAQEKAK